MTACDTPPPIALPAASATRLADLVTEVDEFLSTGGPCKREVLGWARTLPMR